MADETKKPKNSAKAKPVAAGREPVATEEAGAVQQTISLFLAVGLIVSALVAGLVVGYVVAPKGASNTEAPLNGAAPTLTPEQLNSNQLPPSHPAIPGVESSQSTDGGTTSGTPADGQ